MERIEKMEYIKNRVSVIIPTYKRTDTVTRAIDSVIGQTYKDIECIVINDNETDDNYTLQLKEILRTYIDSGKIVFLEQPRHINGAAARNYGIKYAKGEYIAFLDDDDWWKPDKIAKQVSFIKKQATECGGVSTLVEFYSHGRVVRRTISYKGGRIYREILGREVDVATGTVLLKHECLDKAGYFDEKLIRHQELQLLTFFTYNYPIELLPEYLLCMENDDNSNRPSKPNELIRMKKAFFSSVKPVLDTLTDKEKRVIFSLNRLDILYICLKNKKFGEAITELIRILGEPAVIPKIIKRVGRRWKEKRR